MPVNISPSAVPLMTILVQAPVTSPVTMNTPVVGSIVPLNETGPTEQEPVAWRSVPVCTNVHWQGNSTAT